ncbi:MAG: MMPL family transporter [Parvibaculum sp.]
MTRFANPFLRFPRTTMVLCLGLLVLAAAGLGRLSLSSDTRVFFAPEGRSLQQLQAFESKYGQDNSVLLVVAAKDGRKADAGFLKALAELTASSWKLPLSTHVASVTNFPHVVSDADSFSVEDLVPDPAGLNEQDAANILQTALSDKLLVNRLISADGRAAGILINFKLPQEASPEVRQIIAATRGLARAFEKTHPDLEVHLTGNVILMGTFAEAALSDITWVIPASLIITSIVMMLFVRAILPSIAILTLLGLSSAAAMGLAGWYGHIVNTATVACPVIIMTVSMAAAVRIVTTALGALARGLDKKAAISEAINLNLWPVLLTNATTIVGFLSMNLADAPPLREQGNIVVIGIVISFIFTFTWLPAMLVLMELKPAVQRSQNVMVGLGHFVNRYYKHLFLLCTAIVLSCGWWLDRIRLDDDFARYFDNRFEYRRDSDFTEKHLTGLNTIEFDLGAGRESGIYEPSYQRHLAAFVDWLRARPEVVSALAISDITQRIDKAMQPGSRTGPSDAGIIPDDADRIAQYFLLYELSLPYGTSLNDQVNVARSSSRVTAILRNVTSSDIRELNDAATKWIADNTPPEMHTSGISLNVLFANLSGVNIRSMILSTIVSILIIAVVVGVALRSPVYGALSILLNILPSVVGFGLWGLLYQQIGLAASVVTAMTIGLVVDDTIYFLIMYQAARQQGQSAEEAINHVFSTVGVAMLVITASLTIGFGTLVFSGFEVNRSLGAMTAIVIMSNLFIDWLMLPPVMRIMDRTRR